MGGGEQSLDRIDRRILVHLQEDGRLSNAELAERVGLSPSPCLRRVRRLEEDGYIKGYAALLDRETLGLDVTAFVQVSLEKHSERAADRFETAIMAMAEVTECFPVTGEDDYILRVVATDLKAYSRFLMDHLMRLPGITNVKSVFALGEIKATTAVPVGEG